MRFGLAVCLGFAGLAALFLNQVLLGGKVLLPADNLYAFPPWDRFAAGLGVSTPHNELLSDAILQNYGWKWFLRESLTAGQIPLWNPYILAGQPFLASGQAGVLYPPGLIFVLAPLAQAYALYTALHLVLAGGFTFAFLRAIGANRFGATIGGVVFAFCGFMVASFIWPMVLGVAVWLPLALLAAERLIQIVAEPAALRAQLAALARRSSRSVGRGLVPRHLDEENGGPPSSIAPSHSSVTLSEAKGLLVNGSPRPYAPQGQVPLRDEEMLRSAQHDSQEAPALEPPAEPDQSARSPRPAFGADRLVRAILWSVVFVLAIGMQFLAGHMEIGGYLLATAGFYVTARLGSLAIRGRIMGPPVLAAALMVGLLAAGAALAAPQLLPFGELAGQSFRSGSVTYDQVTGWAYKPTQLAGFLMPDFFGNPSHRSYHDLLTAKEVPVTTNYLGEKVQTIFWGTKNYVEGAAYAGILPLLLAAIAVLMRRDRYTWLFAALAALSLAFAFGTPVYGLLYNWVPSYDQLHTPFRWVFPYSFAVAVLAGLGASALTDHHGRVFRQLGSKVELHVEGRLSAGRAVAGLALAGGLLLAMALALSPLAGEWTLKTADSVLRGSASLQRAFPTGRALFFYEFRNFALLMLLLVTSGIVLTVLVHNRGLLARAAAVALVVGDLFFFGMGFNTASDPKLLEFTPPAVKFLQNDTSLYRIISYGPGRPLIPNAPMAYGIQDARGYDSVILRSYVAFMEAIEKQGALLHNRVDSLSSSSSLSSPLLDLLNVKYVVTREKLQVPGLTEVYDSEVRIYRNDSVLPRAFLVQTAIEVADQKEAFRRVAAPGFDPGYTVVVERAAGGALPAPSTAGTAVGPQQQVMVTSYQPNLIDIRAEIPGGGYLVLSDTYYEGWRATVDGEDVPVLRANGTFRAVQLAPGRHTVSFEFKPFSFRTGLFAALIAACLIFLALVTALMVKSYPRNEQSGLLRVAKNSIFPMATSFFNKFLDLGFAMYMLRMLDVESVGSYTFAVVVIGYLDILANFGLGVLLTREVAKDRAAANRYLGNTMATRVGLWVGALGVAGLVVGPLGEPFGVTPDLALAILLFTLGLLPSLISGALSSLFQAYEKFEYPAAVTVLTATLKVALGTVVLAAGMSFVGLAAVSVMVNLVTLAVLFGLASALVFRPRWEFQPGFSWAMLKLSYPLMLNSLLNSVFFRVDSLLLKPMAGAAALGWYGTAFRFIDGLGIISSSFTLALFPLLSRLALEASVSMVRVFTLALKVLLVVSVPLSVGTTLIARDLILFFAGEKYLPHSAVALQILIWFLPFSFVNGLTQYVLIALNQQRFITISFVIAASFNLGTNLLLIPRFGYVGAAVTTILSEWALMIPFWYCIRKNLPPVPILGLAWRPVVAAAVMGVEVWLLRGWNLPVAVLVAPVVYGACLLALGGFDAEERALLAKALPRRRRAPPAESPTLSGQDGLSGQPEK